MKVLVLYENPGESIAAVKLAANIEMIGDLLTNAEVEVTPYSGTQLRVCKGPRWNIEATAAPFETLPKPRPVQPKPRKGQRRLILDLDDEE